MEQNRWYIWNRTDSTDGTELIVQIEQIVQMEQSIYYRWNRIDSTDGTEQIVQMEQNR